MIDDKMNEYSNQSTSELLHHFLDGELDLAHEKQLFNELASSEDLRTEMRELLAVRETVHNDLEAFTPPPESAGIIFSRVGLNPPASPPAAGILRRNVFGILMRRVWLPVSAALLASLVTAWFLTDKYESRFAELEKRIPVIVSFDNSRPEVAPDNEVAQNSAPEAVKERKIYVYQKPVIIYRDMPAGREVDPQPQASIVTEPETPENTRTSLIGKSDLTGLTAGRQLSDPESRQSGRPQGIRSQGYKPLGYDIRKDGRNSLILRGISAASFPAASVPLQGDALFSNMTIGYFFDYTKNIKVGFELGREPFGQEFYNTEDRIANLYQQNPLMSWGALGVRYEMSSSPQLLFGGVPFAQILVGGTEQGPLGKFIGGLQYVSHDMGIGILLGLEGSMLWYENQGRSYSTKKIGFTYGMSFHF